MKLFVLSVLFLFFMVAEALAQTPAELYRKRMMDSIKMVYLTEAAIRNPALRQITVSTDLVSRTRVDTKLYGNKVLDGEMSQVRTTALINVPVKSWKKNSISTSFSLFNQYFDVNQITSPLPDSVKDPHGYRNKLTVGFTASYVRVDSLFGRRVIYTSSITALTGDASSIQKISFLGGVFFTLKQTRVTSISAGVIVNIDPASTIPVLPYFSYRHQFKSNVELNISLPQMITLRKPLSKNCWVSLGTAIAGSVAFDQTTRQGIPGNINYSGIDLKTGGGVECRFGKIFMIGLNAGMMTPVMSRFYERGKNSRDYFVSNKINSTPFLNVTVSVLPFLH
jgi:hypothetical protein